MQAQERIEMDRRYRENQLTEGVGAPGGRAQGRERLVASYLSQAKAVNRQAQSYGGSIGQPGGFYGSEAMPQRQMVSSARGADVRSKKAVFEQVGGRSMGMGHAGFGASRSWFAEGIYTKPKATV